VGKHEAPNIASSEASGEPLAVRQDSEDRLGETVRLLRKRAGLSIQEVAERTGLSTAMISQLERSLATPSIRSLRLLGDALSVPISYFFEPHSDDRLAKYVVKRADRELLCLTASGVLKELLTPNRKGGLRIYELTLNPGATSGSDFVKRAGEKAVYVLSGRIRLRLDHEGYDLEAGDSACFPSNVPHMFENADRSVARLIWMTADTPPDQPPV